MRGIDDAGDVVEILASKEGGKFKLALSPRRRSTGLIRHCCTSAGVVPNTSLGIRR
ncbi:hypothetical protein KIP88_41705 [Bradyrhizobium sp. SRL28]|uniref:hypothetical protein n=1 Tax=Bradyrhizobium sp. SRL28 TaxID=2836178 RepID=UPI001BDF49D9|nr:hypothetical protein [Bradyrhizobium sp. SRL28]MBT1516916.1 hypothetical protein [Bradyrhizobium sp. SRL28]